MAVDRDIRRFFHLNGHIAGGHRQYTILYNNRPIAYNESTNIYGDNHLVLQAGRNASKRPCFVLGITGTTATLESLERGADCFVDNHDSSRDLVLVAVALAKSKGCTKIVITDNSFVTCPAKIQLSNLYFLTHAQTWYESILPVKSKAPAKEINRLRNIATNISWDQVQAGLRAQSCKTVVQAPQIDTSAPGSAMKVMTLLKETRTPQVCKFLSNEMGKIMVAYGIPSFYASEWSANLSPDPL